MFPIQIAQYWQHCSNLSKVVAATLFNTDYPILAKFSKVIGRTSQSPPSSFLKRSDDNFESEFSIKYGE